MQVWSGRPRPLQLTFSVSAKSPARSVIQTQPKCDNFKPSLMSSTDPRRRPFRGRGRPRYTPELSTHLPSTSRPVIL